MHGISHWIETIFLFILHNIIIDLLLGFLEGNIYLQNMVSIVLDFQETINCFVSYSLSINYKSSHLKFSFGSTLFKTNNKISNS